MRTRAVLKLAVNFFPLVFLIFSEPADGRLIRCVYTILRTVKSGKIKDIG